MALSVKSSSSVVVVAYARKNEQAGDALVLPKGSRNRQSAIYSLSRRNPQFLFFIPQSAIRNPKFFNPQFPMGGQNMYSKWLTRLLTLVVVWLVMYSFFVVTVHPPFFQKPKSPTFIEKVRLFELAVWLIFEFSN